MPLKNVLLGIATVIFLLAATATEIFAIRTVHRVSKERANQLGVEVRITAAGPTRVRVELEFESEGELKKFKSVGMQIRDGEELPLVSACLDVRRTSSERNLVRFMASRAYLDKITLRIAENWKVHDVRLRDFVDLDELQ